MPDSTRAYAGSKRKARTAAAATAASHELRDDMARLNALVALIEHESDLDALLVDMPDGLMKDEVRKLILALKAKQDIEEGRIEVVATSASDLVVSDGPAATTEPPRVRER